MEYAIQSHFGAPLGLAACQALKGFRFTMCRIDAQQTHLDDLALILAEVKDAGLKPLVIANDIARLRALPPGTDVEPMNEPNLTGLTAEMYCGMLDGVLPVAAAGGLRLWIPSVSNLNTDGLQYVADVLRLRPNLPAHVGISVHDYDDGNGIAHLKALIGPRRFAVTEFGYNSHVTRWLWWHTGLTDAEAAEKIRLRWVKLATQGATIAGLYQRLDDSDGNSRFGIYRTNGTVKPQAYTISL